ncbi:COG complex component [Punctularia strigosozonata HHB-11173 SS5]|uniref:COG complex component n=1 Tax=Punctularia strigosozonata (strain HHB-11173) TaxID=741275 RepID=UPI0004417334|nr:COG complex component [Punctularia strigosozonata HHB-11173 SS5]EIN11926.1 COG complex component [Punctularia strigosozonata HHB-11173 SS5]
MAIAPSNSDDPYDIERLAKEIEDVPLNDAAAPPLPDFTPLEADTALLTDTDDVYDIDAFLLSRFEFSSLSELRSELRDFLAHLKDSLVQLINDDYEAFISLSTDLQAEGARLERLKTPLGDIKAQVLMSRDELQTLQDEIEAKLQKRAALREEKAFLRQLISISESVTRLESLLHITPSEDAGSSPTIRPAALAPEDERGSSRAKHLSRVAAEYTQLLYHVSKTASSAFIDELRWRIDRISSTLSSDLDRLFSATLNSLINDPSDAKKHKARATEADRARWLADLNECLRTYDALGLWRDAEDVLRREVMRPFVKKTIFPAALSAPLSPLVPHTPFLPSSKAPQMQSQTPYTASFPPRTPYTPYTAFASKQNPFDQTFGAATSSAHAGLGTAHLLDDSEDALAALYNAVLKFVDRDLRRVMESAERISVASGKRPKPPLAGLTLETTYQNGSNKKESETFEIMANVVWAEIGRAIMDELGSVAFSVGNADTFRKHYETTQAFLRSLEFLAPSVHSVEAMRSHPVYKTFERRWQLPAYMHIRKRAIVGKLEEALSEPVDVRAKSNGHSFVTPQANATWVAITSCWSAEVFIPDISASLWKFTLQLLYRYKTWVESSMSPFEPTLKFAAVVSGDKGPGSPAGLTRSATPSTPMDGTSSGETSAPDKTRLRDFASAITDIRVMEQQIWTLWQQEISMMLPDIDRNEEGVEDAPGPEESLRQMLETLTSLIPPMVGQITTTLSKQACDAVAAVKGIPAQVRMSQNRKPPTDPSPFVTTILRPVKAFFAVDGPGEALKDSYLREVTEEVFDHALARYTSYVSQWKKTEESLRRLQRGQKQSAFSLFSAASRAAGRNEGQVRDDERIRAQMIVDVEAFGTDAVSLGVNLEQSKAYKALRETVQAPISDDA